MCCLIHLTEICAGLVNALAEELPQEMLCGGAQAFFLECWRIGRILIFYISGAAAAALKKECTGNFHPRQIDGYSEGMFRVTIAFHKMCYFLR